MRDFATVFVYGSLLKGLSNHRTLGESPFLGESRIRGFRMIDLGAFPGLVYGKSEIKGEVYSVDSETLSRLDELEGNGRFYTRELTGTASGSAWVYVLPTETYGRHREVPDGDWRKYKTEQDALSRERYYAGC